jgi:hypothetical protein
LHRQLALQRLLLTSMIWFTVMQQTDSGQACRIESARGLQDQIEPLIARAGER